MQENRIVLFTFGVVIVVMILLVGFITGILFLYQRKQHAFLSQLEDVKKTYERELLKSQLEVQDQTLQHISREIHDNIGQFISLAKLHLNTIGPGIGLEEAEKIDLAVELLTKSLADLRDVSKSLSLDLIRNGGLPKAIESQVEQLKKIARYTINFRIMGMYEYLDEQKEIIIFRILQEAINNIIRHAQASRIEILLDCTYEEIILQVDDDGKGFNLDRYNSTNRGFKHSGGLNNMDARARLIDADFFVQSKPGSGTTVRITVPFNRQYDPSDSQTN